MATHPLIDPGPEYETVFVFDGQKTVFRTFRHTAKGAKPSSDVSPWVIHVPSVKELGKRADKPDDTWTRRWPGFADPGRFSVHRSFSDLEHMRSAIPEITDFAKKVRSLHHDKPHIVLTFPHKGALDPEHVISIADGLRPAGTHAILVVDHRSKSEE